MKDNKDSHAEEPPGARLPGLTNSPPRILVVNDDRDARQLSVEILTGAGYVVETARDGDAGWEAIKAAPYDLIITDNKMPKMTGIEMIEKVRWAGKFVPIIMATGFLPVFDFVRKPWLKPDAALQQPYSNDELLDAVKKILSNGPRNGATVPETDAE